MMIEDNEDNIAPEDALTGGDDASLDQAVEQDGEAPEFSDDAPGFDMLADADADNGTEVNGTEVNGATNGSYKVLARKYRPRNFDDLIGQEAMVQTLTNAFDSGRIAHGFMLTGVRGVGKTTTARILARALNYQTETMNAPSMALAEDGAHCAAIMDGTHVDVIEMDAASRTGIGDIREIIDNVRYTPSAARFKVYIIDEVHMLSKAAFNGLLKTLEEPPEHVKFIFATTEIRQVPVTVLSRCQRFDLRRLTLDDTQTLLSRTCAAEHVSLPEEALKLIARAADGSARDALSLLDRALAHMDGAHIDPDGSGGVDETTMRGLLGLADRGRIFDLFDLVMAGQVSEALAEFEAQYVMGADPAVILADMAELTHWLTRLKFVPAAQEDIAFSAQLRARGVAAAEKLSTRILSRVWQVLLAGTDEVARAGNARAAAEMVLIRLAHLADMPSPEELIKHYDAAPKASAAPASNSGGAASGGASAGGSHASGPVASHGSTAASTAPAVMAQTQNAPVLQNFQAVVDMVAEKRDIGLKHALENGVHLVAFEAAAFTPQGGARAGRIELRLAEGQDNVAQELTRKLRDWTGQSWVVSLSKEQGAATIGAVKQSAADRREEAALEDPFIKTALAAFPKAEIVSISDFDTGLSADNGEVPLDDGEASDTDADA